MKIKSLVLVLSAAGTFAIAQPAFAQMSTPIMAGGDAMMVSVPNDMLTVDSVNADADGFIVVHKVADGKSGAVIGHAAVTNRLRKNRLA